MPFYTERIEPHFRQLLDLRANLDRAGPRGYALSCCAPLTLMLFALWLRLWLAPVSAGLQYVTFFPAVTLAALIGGYRSGLLATLIGLAFATCIFTAPYYTLSIEVLRNSLWSNLVFLTDGLVISFAIEALHRYRLHYEAAFRQSIEAQASLAQQATQQKRILDNLFCYVALLDPQGKVLEMNQAPLARSGLRREDVIGKPFSEGPWWGQDKITQAQLMQAMDEARQGIAKRYDVPVMMGQEQVFIDFQISPIFNNRGEVVAMLPTAVEITDRKRAEEHLQAVSERLLLATQAGGVGIWDWDLASNTVEWDDQTFALYGIARGDYPSATAAWLASLLPDDKDEAVEMTQRALRGEVDYDTEFRVQWPDGSIHCIRSIATIKRNAAGQALRMVGTNWDITEAKETERQLNIAAVTFNSHEGIMIVDPDERILRVNTAFEEITGYKADEVMGQTPRILSSGRHSKDFFVEMWQSIAKRGFWQGEIWDRRKSGEIYPKWVNITAVRDCNGQLTEYVAIFNDITERKQSEDKIHNLAFYDALTGLPNRRLLQDRLSQVLLQSGRTREPGALLFIDLDNFKALNDTKGHERGDQLLQQAASRILACTRYNDTVARLGGDEFMVILTELSPEDDAAPTQVKQIAKALLAALNQIYLLTGYEHRCTASIGVTLFDAYSSTEDDLMRQADIALYQAKSAGKNTIQFFDPEMQEAVNLQVQIERELQSAVADGQLQLYYQVQLDNDNHPFGAEALLRWMHPERGLVSPALFIPVAESSGLIVEIGNWVLETACQQLDVWSRDAATQHLILAINVSANQFCMHDFVDGVEHMLKLYRIDPAKLKLELTESVIVSDVGDVVKKMYALKALGVRISLDDFGTGYSSLSYLKRLPIDQLKIDQSFVRDIVSDTGDAVMVKTIIEMAKNFGLNVIAEGVETQAQYDFLKTHGCVAYQGYLFGKPLPILSFMDALDDAVLKVESRFMDYEVEA